MTTPSPPPRQRWWADTLSKRLFVLLWVTLVFSHMLGFWLVHPGGETGAPMGGGPGWLIPRLPPGLMPGGGGPGPGEHKGLAPWQNDGRGPRSRPPQEGVHDGFPQDDGVPEESKAPRPGPAFGGPRHDEPGMGREPSNTAPAFGRQPPHSPPSLWLDYLARVLVMGVAAWLGARWLTSPMRRLARASQALEQSLGKSGEPPPLLDESGGPLEVRQTAHVFNNMSRSLREQFAQRGLMMAAVSHDLRTPLTRLRMRLESLRPDPVAERCITDVQDINAMIESVLDVMNEERRQEPWQAVDLLAMAQAMADDLQEAGHAVTAEGEAVTVQVQPIAFKRVLANLVSNALRYGQRADIRVACLPALHDDQGPCREVRITIDDQGPGIPADQLEAVFRPFVRLDTSRSRDSGGVGLGLYIARELMLRHGGQVRLSNRPEGGLRAELTLPAR